MRERTQAEIEAALTAYHGDGDCHICGKPKVGEGSSICSYPHGRVPDKPVDPAHPDGFWTWKIPHA